MRTIHSFRLVALAAACSLMFSVAGCATLRANASDSDTLRTTRPAAASAGNGADFAWSVSGDPAVRPIQVFSIGGQTYFQMRPGQNIPAVFVGNTPIPFAIEPPYIVITGKPSTVNLIADGSRAVVVHDGPATAATSDPERVQRVDVSTMGHPNANGVETYAAAPEVPQSHVSVATVSTPSPIVNTDPANTKGWQIYPSDKMLSHALARWCSQDGITLHWNAPIDLPIEAPSNYPYPKLFAAMAALLDAAGNASGYHFYYSVEGNVITVVANPA